MEQCLKLHGSCCGAAGAALLGKFLGCLGLLSSLARLESVDLRGLWSPEAQAVHAVWGTDSGARAAAQYEPAIAELRCKYEAVVRERALLVLQRDRLAAAVNGQVRQVPLALGCCANPGIALKGLSPAAQLPRRGQQRPTATCAVLL